MNLFILLTIPLIISGAAFALFKVTITWKEFLLHVGVAVVLVLGTWQLARWNSMSDTEHWNGRITDKDNGTEGCCHSYKCNCETCTETDAKGNVTTYECNCQTCYEHIYDYWWQLDFSTGDRIHDGCNGSGSEPGWWHRAYVGEPASLPHSYTNYLKADPDSLFVKEAPEHLLAQVPDFPEIEGRYHVRKIVEDGVKAPSGWQPALEILNADLGSKKQVDLTVVLTKSNDPDYAYALERKWLYGPKNAFIVVLGVPDGKTIRWARGVTISKVEPLKIHVREYFEGKPLDDPAHIHFLRDSIEVNFHRLSMSEFEYLAASAEPKGWALFFLYFVNLAISIGLAILMHKQDVFGDERRVAWRL